MILLGRGQADIQDQGTTHIPHKRILQAWHTDAAILIIAVFDRDLQEKRHHIHIHKSEVDIITSRVVQRKALYAEGI